MLPQVYKTAQAQIDLSKQKIVCSDRILLPHTTKIKPLQYCNLSFLLTHFFLVMDYIELCIKSHLTFAYFFKSIWIKTGLLTICGNSTH